jgi:hypothetical protein
VFCFLATAAGEKRILHTVNEGDVSFRSRWQWITVTLDADAVDVYSDLKLEMRTASTNNDGLQIGHWHLGFDENGAMVFK